MANPISFVSKEAVNEDKPFILNRLRKREEIKNVL